MGVKDLYDGIAGYDIITGEHLSSQERTDKLLLGTGVMSFNLLLPVLSGLGVGKTIGQKLRTKADDLFRLEGVSPRILGETANELAEHTVTSGIASELSTPNGYGSTVDITAITPSPAGESIEETVEAVSREGVEELQEQAVTEVAEVIESSSYSVDEIIKGVENGGIPLSNNIQKGNYGEMKMDAYFESQGYERISLARVTDLNTPTHQGIDGVYYNPDGHPPYIIGEAKYGSSRLSTLVDGTPQMSGKWIIDRLENAVGGEAANDIKMVVLV